MNLIEKNSRSTHKSLKLCLQKQYFEPVGFTNLDSQVYYPKWTTSCLTGLVSVGLGFKRVQAQYMLGWFGSLVRMGHLDMWTSLLEMV